LRSGPAVGKNALVASSSSSLHRASAHQHVVVPIILVTAALLWGLYSWTWTQSFLKGQDRMILDEFHVHGRKTPELKDVVILAIDDVSVNLTSAFKEDFEKSPTLGYMKQRYPWPRRVWASVIDKLADSGAKLIFLDLVFSGDSPDPEDDRLLKEALARHRDKVIVGAKFDQAVINDQLAVNFSLPNPAIIGACKPEDGTWGVLNFWMEDGIIRQSRYRVLASQVEEEMLREDDPQAKVIRDPAEKKSPSAALAIAQRLVGEKAGEGVGDRERIRFCNVETYPPVTIAQIFFPDLWHNTFHDGAVFKDKIIMAGPFAQQLQDLQPTPLGPIAGVRLHAHALSALLSKSFIYQAPPSVLWGCLIAGALLAWALVTWVHNPLASMICMGLLTVAAGWLAFEVFNRMNIEASPLPFALALDACGLLGLTGNYLSHLKESRKLSGFISRYHSPDRVSQLLRDRGGLFETLGGVERTVTLLFSDVRGFTSHSEGMGPKQLVTQLNEYLTGMVEQVFVYEGSIDKFIGDAVMALWGNMPRRVKDGDGTSRDAQRAVASALAMRARLIVLNEDWIKRGMHEWKFGIGIHQGNVVVANIGSAPPHERMELTVIGDNVNLSSRLEGLTKDYECDIIVSEAIYQHIQSTHLCRPLGETKVKGKEIGVKIYFVEGLREGREEPGWFPLYAEAMQALFLEKRASKARALLEQCHARAPEDRMINRFLEKIEK